jgi:site-specific recombinase XerD
VTENQFEAFIRWLRSQDKSENTIHAYTTAVGQFATWFRQTNGKSLTPEVITPLDVKAWRQHLRVVRELSASTVNQYLAGVRSYVRWAKSSGKIEHNPTNGIKMVKQMPSPPRWLERTEQFALLRAAQEAMQLGRLRAQGRLGHPGVIWSRRDNAILVMMLNSGLRLSEVEALNLSDIEIKERSGSVHVRQGKGRKERTVPLNHDARKALQQWLEVRPEEQDADDDEPSKALFLSQTGGRLSARSISYTIGKLADKADLKDVTPHTLRHSFAKNLVDAGVTLEKVATLLGHDNLETTRIYTRPSEADLQAATERVSWEED